LHTRLRVVVPARRAPRRPTRRATETMAGSSTALTANALVPSTAALPTGRQSRERRASFGFCRCGSQAPRNQEPHKNTDLRAATAMQQASHVLVRPVVGTVPVYTITSFCPKTSRVSSGGVIVHGSPSSSKTNTVAKGPRWTAKWIARFLLSKACVGHPERSHTTFWHVMTANKNSHTHFPTKISVAAPRRGPERGVSREQGNGRGRLRQLALSLPFPWARILVSLLARETLRTV
jgi:hypothetical protein